MYTAEVVAYATRMKLRLLEQLETSELLGHVTCSSPAQSLSEYRKAMEN